MKIVAAFRKRLEWVGGIAVIASLLLVAFEIRQNTNAISAQAVYDLNESAKEMLLILATDAELARLMHLGGSDPDALDSDEWYRFRMYVWANLNMYESAWDYYRRGIVGDGYMEGWKVDYCETISLPGFKRALTTLDPVQATEFQKSVNDWCVSDD